MFVTAGILLHLVDRAERARDALWLSFAFGLGMHLAGTWWMYISLERYGGLAPVLAALATLLVGLWMGAGTGLAGLAAKLAARKVPAGFLRLMAIAAVWSGLETYVRGLSTLGFPWLVIGNTQVPDGLLAGHVPMVGTQGVSVLVALVAAALVEICRSLAGARTGHGLRSASAPLAVATLLAASGQGFLWFDATEAKGKPVPVSLLQGNVPQDLKWVAENRPGIVSGYLRMVDRSTGSLVVLPETALPITWEDLPPDVEERLRSAGIARDGAVLTGVFSRGRGRGYQNAVAALGEFESRPHPKVRLAPFGEYVPLGFLFAPVARALDIPYSELDPGEGRELLRLPVGDILVAICYEDIFPGEFSGLAPEADFLVNVTNGAWFGESRMLDQHLQISQARALETGREMLRSTNTGVTAHVGHRGEVLAALPPHQQGILETEVTPRTRSTPYVAFGHLLLFGIILAALGLAWISRPR